ncbi:fungal fruit body lectin [Russula brevipes]|nr:fungal fruit body lectin [Russula brevipes]
MVYTITAQIYQTNTNAFFHVVEKTIWGSGHAGTWSEIDGAHVLTIGASGASGCLRFRSDTDEFFIVALGIHEGRRWGDIDTLLGAGDTGIVVHPQYYSDAPNLWPRVQQREAQLTSYHVTSLHNRTFSFIYTVPEGRNLKVAIIIG